MSVWVFMFVCVCRMDVTAPTNTVLSSCIVCIHLYFVYWKENSHIHAVHFHIMKTSLLTPAVLRDALTIFPTLNWMRWTPHSHRHRRRRRRQRTYFWMFSIFLCCFLFVCVRCWLIMLMLSVRFAFTWLKIFTNKNEQNKSDNSVYVYAVRSHIKKGLLFLHRITQRIYM